MFDAVELRRFTRDGARILHAELRIDDTVLMLADGTDAWVPAPAHVHIYVPDVDATWARALAAGGVPVMEPVQQQGDDDKRGGVKDAAGTTWWIATKVG